MKTADITVEFITNRKDQLTGRWAVRNSRMDDYQRLYLLDLFETKAEPDERRLVAPICWTRVEAFRPLFLTKPPVISVPASEIKAVEQKRADELEKYLYGVWYQCQVMDTLDKAEFFACNMGEGVIRCVYDSEFVGEEVPLLIQPLDPRTVYATPGARPGQDLEVLHYFQRRRREIEQEWDHVITKNRPGEDEIEAWLDEEIEYMDYWRVDVKTEKVDVELEAEAEEELGPLASAMGWVQDQWDNVFGGGEPKEEKPTEQKTVRSYIITNAVVADEEFVKQPAHMPGYRQLPFIRYPGISTGLQDENGQLSVLFPIAGGQRDSSTTGLAGGMTQLINATQQIILAEASSAIITNDQGGLKRLDFGIGAINQIEKDADWSFLVPPGPHPAIAQQLQLFETLIEDATVSRSMMGRYVGDMSGLALSTINNPVLMKVASRQMIRERAYQWLNALILSLTERYAPPEGWYVTGPGKMGQMNEIQLKPSDIQGYHTNRVELSASLPKDEAGEIMSLSNLVDRKQISRETFLDQLQRIKRLSSQSPADEMKRILRDAMIFDSPLTERLSELVLADYDPALAALLEQVKQPQGPPGMPPGGPAGGPAQSGAPGPGGPMQGMPPSVLPPGAVPSALGQAQMMGMQGQGPPGPGGVMPGG